MTTFRKALRWLRPEGVPRDVLLAFVPFGLFNLVMLAFALFQGAHPDVPPTVGKALFAAYAVVMLLVSFPAMFRWVRTTLPPRR